MALLVSILIPAYRAEQFIQQTITSATDQTWPHKEIIVVVDGSPDRTFEVARRLESHQVKVVQQDNTGVCIARNNALQLAQGDYIQWLDADDLLHPGKIAAQLATPGADRDSRVLLTSAWGKFFSTPSRAEFRPDKLWQDHGPVEWILTRFSYNLWMNPAVWLVSRRLTDLAGPWDPRLARSGDDDGEYICRVAAASEQVRFVSEAKCYYRIGSPGSLNWNMETSEGPLGALRLSLLLAVDHLIALENSDRTRQAALQHLRTFSAYFYGVDAAMFAPLQEKAKELGGELPLPTANWKYRPLEKAFGRPATRMMMKHWRAAKLLARARFERAISGTA